MENLLKVVNVSDEIVSSLNLSIDSLNMILIQNNTLRIL
jgi:hypothetical protein